jgi:hypothetical protein
MDWLTIGIIVAGVLLVLALYCVPMKSEYMSRSSEEQEQLITMLIQRIAPIVKGRVFEKREIDDMLGGNPLYDQIMHYHFTTLLNRGILSTDSLRFALTGRKSVY